MGRIMVLGDVHGDFAAVNALIAQQRPDLILQCGDWGFWLGVGLRNPLKLQGTQVRWCRGNHEDHFLLRAALDGRREAVELDPGVIHQPDGSTFTLADGRVVVFLGGSASVDWKLRVMGKNWFPEEVLEPPVLERLPDRADIVVSHTLPTAIFMASGLHREGAEREALELRTGWDLSPDPSMEVLEEARKRLRPSLWYASHFHKLLEGELDNCAWVALDQITGGDAAWRWLPEALEGGREET